MRWIILLFFCLVFGVSNTLLSKDLATERFLHTKADDATPVFSKLYFNLNSGINSYSGILGIGMEAVFLDQYSLYAGYGFSMWGNRFSIGAKTYITSKRPYGSSIFALYSHSNGFDHLDVNIERRLSSGTKVYEVAVSQDPISSVILGYEYNLRIIDAIRFNMQVGGMLRLSQPVTDYYDVVEGADQVDSFFQDFMRFSAPGGIMIALGFSFNLMPLQN